MLTEMYDVARWLIEQAGGLTAFLFLFGPFIALESFIPCALVFIISSGVAYYIRSERGMFFARRICMAWLIVSATIAGWLLWWFKSSGEMNHLPAVADMDWLVISFIYFPILLVFSAPPIAILWTLRKRAKEVIDTESLEEEQELVDADNQNDAHPSDG